MNNGAIRNEKAARLLVSGVFLLCFTSLIMAQRPAGAGPPPNNNPNLQDRSRQVEEGKLRSVEMETSVDQRSEKLLQAAIANMKEDFSRIQVLRNDIARNLVARKPLDYQLISEQTAEINKRASRLNVYMRARNPEDEKQDNSPEVKSEEMTAALVRLCKLIDSFTENPALKDAAIVDAKEIAKAKENKANADRDLLAIIKLSANLQKQSENVRKSQ